jgi:hypothetical protein
MSSQRRLAARESQWVQGGLHRPATPQHGKLLRAEPPGLRPRGRPSGSRSNPWSSGPLLAQSLSSLLTPHRLGPDPWDWQEASGRKLAAAAGHKKQYALNAASVTHRPETSNETSSFGGGGSSGSRNRTSKMAAPSASPPLPQADGSLGGREFFN